ncbi:MAG: tetratricopeptide repeat protein [Alphaproteobacteria bacterium]|nr:tetratricopeptide repeat protein [Alphaproteobacteria bacterium]
MAKNVKKDTKNATVKTVKKSAVATQAKRVARDTSNVNPEYTDAFIQEVDEDVHNENLKIWWNRYGAFVILFVVLAVTATVSFDKIRNWKIAQNQKTTEEYMLAAQVRDNAEETLGALQKVSKDNKGIFSDFARLQIANVLFQQEKTDEALETLQKLVDDKQTNSEVKHIALIKIATYKVDTITKEEMEKLLEPVLAENNSWRPLAQDLLAMSAVKNGDLDAAKSIYEGILQIKDLPENFRVKIQDMLSSLNEM